MANTYSPPSVGVAPPQGGFQQGGWYQGRQFWAGTLSDPGTIHPQSDQQGAGERVSAEVNAQSAAKQGVSPQQLESYLEKERQKSAGVTPTSSSSGRSTSPGSGDIGLGAPDTIDLPELYKSLQESAGIKALEDELAEKERILTETKGKINDNPYLSEGTRVGRVRKLESLHAERTANLRSEIATKKADIETQMNLELQQYNIESAASQQALSNLSTFIQNGWLDNAGGEEIAKFTRSTGVSSSMIYSAIDAQKAKNVQTQAITYDDGTNQGFAIINSNTGEIISKQAIAGSKPTSGGKLSEWETKMLFDSAAEEDIRAGKGVREVFGTYQGLIDPNDLLSLYNAKSPHGRAYEIDTEPELLSGYGVNVKAFQGL